MPIAAELVLASPAADGPITCTFDWRHQGEESWDIEIGVGGGRLVLSGGGSRLALDGATVASEGPGEYSSIYARFAELVEKAVSEVDLEPLRITADAFMAARRRIVAPFED